MSFEEKLVELVRQNSVLYDLSNENYRRTDIKDKIWRDIVINLNSSESACKTRFKSLRDTYKKARRSEPSGSPAIVPDNYYHKKKWKYFELMSFLDGVDDQAETVGNFDNSYQSSSNTNNSCDDNSFDYPEYSNPELNEHDEIFLTPAKKKKPVSGKEQIHSDFSNFLNTASKTISEIDKAPTKPTSSTATLFSSLSLKIENANLPSDVLDELEIELANLVYKRLREHKRNS